MKIKQTEEDFCDHEYEPFIDPESGGFIKCKKCGHEIDCEVEG